MNITEDRLSKATVTGHLLIAGTLVLESPLLIGRGVDYSETENTVDSLVLVDGSGNPYIPGTSLAGVLRDRLSAYEDGRDKLLTELLFGSDSQVREARQSAVRVEDITLKKNLTARGNRKLKPEMADIVVREGVRINPATGTGEMNGKFNYEVVERGTEGEFLLDITLRGGRLNEPVEGLAGLSGGNAPSMRDAVNLLLAILEQPLALGAMTAKGLGRVKVENLKTYIYDFTKKKAVAAWLTGGRWDPCKKAFLVNLGKEELPAEKNVFTVDAEFSLRSSLLVRDYRVSVEDHDKHISAVQLTSAGDYVIPGTTMKGVLRSRMDYVLRRLGLADAAAEALIGDLMGSSSEEEKKRSRLEVEEIYLPMNGRDVVAHAQTRNRVDRFTNATVDGALFATKPLWKDSDNAPVRLRLKIRRCSGSGWEIGCVLFLIRDLWTGAAAVGGEKGIGRGALKGRKAVLSLEDRTWRLDSAGRVDGDREELERYARAFLEQVKGGKNHE